MPGSYPGGATLRTGATAATGWFLAEDAPARALGPALAWARQQEIETLHVLAAEATGVLARRASLFAAPPSVAVWRVDGRSLEVADPEPIHLVEGDPTGSAFADMLRTAGADVVVEHGVLTGEVLGLEVARVVDDRLEVGVGRHDREAFALVHGDVPSEEALARVVAAVRTHRRPGAPDHPLQRIAAERWLRAGVLARPDLVGATALEPVAGAVPRAGVKDREPAVALGVDSHGAPVVVVCSVGIDLDLVPAAADARLLHDPPARLVLAVPERDAHAVTRALAGALVDPADVVTLPNDWRTLRP